MVIENKLVTHKHTSGAELNKTYLELIFMCLDNPPPEGFKSLSEMKKRGDIQDKIEDKQKFVESFEFTDKEFNTIKSAVQIFPWAFNCKLLREFIEIFQ